MAKSQPISGNWGTTRIWIGRRTTQSDNWELHQVSFDDCVVSLCCRRIESIVEAIAVPLVVVHADGSRGKRRKTQKRSFAPGSNNTPPMPIKIAVTNHSTLLSDEAAECIVSACRALLDTFCADWNILKPELVYYKKGTAEPAPMPNTWQFVFSDKSDVDGALAYHTDEHGSVKAYTFVKTILDSGGVRLYDGNKETVASAFCHEVMEALIDPFCNSWADGLGPRQYSYEVCDPVQDGIVPVKVESVTVGLSNYVLPSWFDPQVRGGRRFDHLGQLGSSLSMTPGGYMVVRDGLRREHQIFGHAVPPQQQQRIRHRLARRTHRTALHY